MTKPTHRSLTLPEDLNRCYEQAAELVAQSSPLLAEVPVHKIKFLLIESELGRSQPKEVANRFIRAALRQANLVRPTTAPKPPVPMTQPQPKESRHD